MCWILRAGLGWAVPAASSVLFIVSNSHLVRFSQPVCVHQFSLHLDASPGSECLGWVVGLLRHPELGNERLLAGRPAAVCNDHVCGSLALFRGLC